MGPRRIAAAALLFGSLFLAAPARADELADLEKARAAYASRNYDDADARLRALLDPKTGTLREPQLVADARMYWGAVMLAKKRNDEAAALFEKLLLDRPEYEPDPLSFPQEVLNFFIDTRSKIRSKLAAEQQKRIQDDLAKKKREQEEKDRQVRRLAMLESLAAQETITQKNSRLAALVPFGYGQFQNGQNGLGWAFLLTESALGLASLAIVPFYVQALYDMRDAQANRRTDLAEGYLDRAKSLRTANLILFGSFIVTAVTGIVQAQVGFVPERSETRKRPIPAVGTSIVPVLGGATFSLEGRF
jgi:hypothetical protein